jgi:hypothetical protein
MHVEWGREVIEETERRREMSIQEEGSKFWEELIANFP